MALDLPTPGADAGTWGTKLNQALNGTGPGTLSATYAARPLTDALGILYAGLATRLTTPCALVFAGSSTTEGYKATAPENRYVNRLAAYIRAAYPSELGVESPVVTLASGAAAPFTGPGVHIYNNGRSGAQASDYLTGTEVTQIGTLNPRMVLHMIGSNDFLLNVPPATYKATLLSKINSLNTAIAGPCVHLLVQTYERWDNSGDYPWTEYGDAMRELAEADPDTIAYLDISRAYVLTGVPSTDPLGLIDPDNVHQNDAGHAFMADLLRKEIGIPGTTATEAAPAEPVVSDDFDRADAATLGNADSGQAWTAASGTWTIAANKAVPTVGGNAVIEAGTGNIDAAIDITFSTAGGVPGLLFRYGDETNRMGAFIDAALGGLVLYQMSNGSNIPLTTYAFTPANQTYRVRVVASGATIYVYLDGTLGITYTLSAGDQTKFGVFTKIGMRCGLIASGNPVKFDNLTATPM